MDIDDNGPTEPPDSEGGAPRLNRAVQAEIGRRLRVFYDTLKGPEEPVPERFRAIIERFEEISPREQNA